MSGIRSAFDEYVLTGGGGSQGSPVAVAKPPVLAPETGFFAGGAPVSDSAELWRILALPRRTLGDPAPLQAKWKALLGKGDGPCSCQTVYHRRCCRDLLPVQALALEEVSLQGGLLGPIGVGHGKTLLDLLAAVAVQGCRTAVLLLPPSLREQLLSVDWDFYGQHWKLPNLFGAKWQYPGRPTLHVLGYSELSGAKNSDILTRINPDLVIADEVHHIRNASAARTKRFKRYFKSNPHAKLVCWSGTLTSRSLRDFGHLADAALKEGSPVPRDWHILEEWASALDPSDFPKDPGVLTAFGVPVRNAYSKFVRDTPGVVSSPSSGGCDSSLSISQRSVICPASVREAYNQLKATWQRPDGEELIEQLAVGRCAREIASGFFYRWKWPRGEPKQVIDRWLAVRKEWHKELRDKLKGSKEYMDSPLLLAKAAIRWHSGYTHDAVDYPRHTKGGPLPVWASQFWPEWLEVRDTAKPETEAVWIDDFLVKDCAEWLKTNTGVCWYDHSEFGAAVSKASGKRLFGPGNEDAAAILRLDGSDSVVASIRSHGTGKNLQMFSTALVANPPADGATWEQLLGRHHRQGQLADEVNFHVYRHLEPMSEAIDKARELAIYIKTMTGGEQKLLLASYNW